jgi:hypothetical protein
MSIVVIVLIVLLIIIAAILVIAALNRKDYNIECQIIINSNSQRVFDYIRHLKNQDNFNKWVMADPEMKRTYSGNDGTVGFIYGWNSAKQSGEGEQEIKKIAPGKSIETEIRFVRPFPSVAKAVMMTETLPENQTKVSWTNASYVKYPMNILLPMIKKMLAKDMDTSLGHLKQILEK